MVNFDEAKSLNDAYLNYNKNALIYNLSAIIERYLRIVARAFKPEIDISEAIWEIKKKVFDSIGLPYQSEQWNALSLPAGIRNTIHNNGIYVNPSLIRPDENFIYRNQQYNFISHTPHRFATYENLTQILFDFLVLIKTINTHPTIAAKKG